MLHVVAYDIASAGRLRRVSALCEDYGLRIQKSVFEFRLAPPVFAAFWRRLGMLLDASEDSVVAYPVDGCGARKIRTLGRRVRPGDGAYVF